MTPNTQHALITNVGTHRDTSTATVKMCTRYADNESCMETNTDIVITAWELILVVETYTETNMSKANMDTKMDPKFTSDTEMGVYTTDTDIGASAVGIDGIHHLR